MADPDEQAAPPDRPRWREMLYPDSESGPFRVRLWFDTVAGRPAICGLEMWGSTPAVAPDTWLPLSFRSTTAKDTPAARAGFVGPEESVELALPRTAIGAKDVRLPLGAWLDDYVRWNLGIGLAALELGADEEKVVEHLQKFPNRRRGHPPLSDEFLREVAELWQRAVNSSDRRAPALAVAAWLEEKRGLVDVKHSTVRQWKKKAEKRFPELFTAKPAPVKPDAPAAKAMFPERYRTCVGCEARLPEYGPERLCPTCKKKLARPPAWWVKEKP
jgi:hypothetical protein